VLAVDPRRTRTLAFTSAMLQRYGKSNRVIAGAIREEGNRGLLAGQLGQ
jgi:hypothetical protein